MKVDQQLKSVALSLSGLVEACPPEHLGDLLDLTAGALASFLKARELKYQDDDRIGKALPDDYYGKLACRIRRMAEGTLPPRGRWISGYYFNSALFRLGAARAIARDLFNAVDKLNKTKGKNLAESRTDQLYEEYRKLKHALRALRTGRNITFAQAVESLANLVDVLESRKVQFVHARTKFPTWKNTR